MVSGAAIGVMPYGDINYPKVVADWAAPEILGAAEKGVGFLEKSGRTEAHFGESASFRW